MISTGFFAITLVISCLISSNLNQKHCCLCR